MTDKDLLSLAEEARLRAYAPYSGYSVGAAALCRDRRIYLGCNIENASYGACLCAERAAIAGAVCDGNREVVKIAVAGSGSGICTPCGICRQVIFEFSPECLVVCGSRHNNGPSSALLRRNSQSASDEYLLGHILFSIRDLLPSAFSGNMLNESGK